MLVKLACTLYGSIEYRLACKSERLLSEVVNELALTFPSAFTSIGIIPSFRWITKSNSRRELSVV